MYFEVQPELFIVRITLSCGFSYGSELWSMVRLCLGLELGFKLAIVREMVRIKARDRKRITTWVR